MKRFAVALALALAGCYASTQPVQVVELGPRPAPPWSAVREALVGCAQSQGVAGQLRVRIDIDPDGAAGGVSASQGGGDLAQCIGHALAAVRFPASHRGRAIEVPIAL